MFFARRLAGRQLHLCRASSSTSKNAALIKTLKQLIQEQRQQAASIARIRVLVKGVEYLSKLPYKLTSKEMAEELPLSRAFTRVLANHLPSISHIEVPVISETKRKQLIQDLTSFDGLYSRRASQLILLGCRSKDDLLLPKFFNMLPETIQYNVRLASHIEKSVTRQQTEVIADFIRDTFPKCEIIPVGSYRRGELTSSCARILIIHSDMHHIDPPPRPHTGYFQPLFIETLKSPRNMRDLYLHNTIIPLLMDKGLAFAPRLCRWSQWVGILRVPKKEMSSGAWETTRQRVKDVESDDGDFVLGRLSMLPSKSRGAAILYHTGSKPFIRLIKNKARELGMYFDNTGLWQWHPAPDEVIVDTHFDSEPDIEEDEEENKSTKNKTGKEKLDQLKVLENGKKANGFWQLLPSMNEEVIFERLGMEYVVPEERK